MLILTRRIGESIYIGDEVRLTVLEVRGTQVRLGINAPKDIPVHREEIYYKIKHEQSGEASSHGNESAQDYEQTKNIAPDTPADAAQHIPPEEADPHNS